MNILDKLKDGVLSLDPVHFVQNNLTLDGKPFRLYGNGYKPFCDIYRYIGIRALDKNSKPVVLVKGRQVGATTMAAALELFFVASGNFGINGRAPMRVLHAFPLLDIAYQYSKTKLNPMITGAVQDKTSKLKGKPRSKIEAKIDKSVSSNNSLNFKQFENGNHIQIESTGLNADRLRGRQLCLETELPTPNGFVKLKDLKLGDELFDENGEICKVTKLHPIQESPESYQITFDNETTVDACAEHLWLTYTKRDAKLKIKNTKEILYTIKDNHSIPGSKKESKVKQRFIKSIKSIKSKPMRCITVDSQSHLYLITRQYIPTHNTVDCILYDEFQDMNRTAYVNSSQILAKAQYGIPGKGIRVLFGTPKQKGTVYWDIWQNSTQQYYYLGCEKCEKHFPLYTPESDEWESIWIEDDGLAESHPNKGFIVKCTHCDHKQDKRPAAERGKWVATKPDDECEYIGFHINQLYMPDFRRKDIISKKPENNVEYTERAWMNEILGEFYAGDAAPLTPEEVKEFCGDMDRSYSLGISISDQREIHLGCDWGDKIDMSQFSIGDREKKTRGQSYSSAVVIAVDGSGLVSIEYAGLLKRNDFEYKKSLVNELFRRYSINGAVGDIGHANDLTEVLHADYGDKFLGSRATGSMTNHIKFMDDIFPKEIRFDKNHYIAELLDLMKHGKIRFPYKKYEQVGWLVNHCTSMEIKPSLDRAGNIKIGYVKGSTPNDGFMALLNAWLSYKFSITKGFKVKNPKDMRSSKFSGPPIIGAYIPELNPWKK